MKKLKQELSNYPKILVKGGASVAEICEAEEQLGISLDKNIKIYLKEFGALSFEGMELTGLGYSTKSYRNLIHATDVARKNYNIPNNSILLEDIGENHCVIYCLKDGVYYWGNGKLLEKINNSLEEYILMRLNEENG
jgi:SUKH superfamily protein